MKSVKKERMCEELCWRKRMVHVQWTCLLPIYGERIIRELTGKSVVFPKTTATQRSVRDETES